MRSATISTIKTLISPPISAFFPKFTKPTSSFPLISPPSLFSYCSFTDPLKSPNFYHLNPPILTSSCNSNPSRACSLCAEAESPLQLPSGEIHMIVGPMFAGKTSTLLRRVRAESVNGRFGLNPLSLFGYKHFLILSLGSKIIDTFSCLVYFLFHNKRYILILVRRLLIRYHSF